MYNLDLLKCLDALLSSSSYHDYCPNGLQIAGKERIKKVICGVSLTRELIDIAIAKHADAIIVHHGAFWNKTPYNITGIQYNRIAPIIKNDINLFAYHLPLDNHPQLGNNFQLAKLLQLSNIRQDSGNNLLWFGELAHDFTLQQFAAHYQSITQHKPVYFARDDKLIRRIGLCTGGAVSLFDEAIKHNIDMYITGEIKENVMGQSLESDVGYLAGGHYATERYGIMALAEYLRSELNLDAEFIELYNPI